MLEITLMELSIVLSGLIREENNMNKMILKKEYLGFEDASIGMKFVDEDFDMTEITVKWDGCCNIFKHSNGRTVTNPSKEPDDVDYIHICELKEYIDMLTQVYEKALEKGYEV